MKFLSLKWKFALSMTALSLVIVILYILLAKQTFESDKISYVYDTQQTQVALLSQALSRKIEAVIVSAESVVTNSIKNQYSTQNLEQLNSQLKIRKQTYFFLNPQTKKLETYGDSEQKLPLAIEQWPTQMTEPGLNNQITIRTHNDSSPWEVYVHLGQNTVLCLMDIQDEMSQLLETQGASLLSSKGFFNIQNLDSISDKSKEDLTTRISKSPFASTFAYEMDNQSFLVSHAPLSIANFHLILFSRTEVALEALSILFQRSLFFLIFSIAFLFAVAFYIARKLTFMLEQLTQTTEKISRGEFQSSEPLKTNDEIGILSSSFELMKKRILELLAKTKETARMEQELQTAKLVQESLFPHESGFKLNHIEIKGHFQTSTECGGDWWYYFRHEDHLYIVIADATGHGTPAALITSTARTCFSFYERQPPDLKKMMQDWSTAVSQCSNQRVFMTGMIFKIHTLSGEFEFVNACHEPPFLFKKREGLFFSEPLDLETNKTLGEEKEISWVTQYGKIDPDEKLMIFTDGLFAVVNPNGEALSEKRALKKIQKIADVSEDLTNFAQTTVQIFEDHRQGAQLPDDITIVFVHNILK